MAIDPEFAELMQQTITVQPLSSRNNYGEPTHGTAEEVSCHLKQVRTKVRDASGKEVTASHVAVTYGATTIETTDKVTLPDGSSRPVLAVETAYDETGTRHHQRVYIQ